jgi:hypothetical protein
MNKFVVVLAISRNLNCTWTSWKVLFCFIAFVHYLDVFVLQINRKLTFESVAIVQLRGLMGLI